MPAGPPSFPMKSSYIYTAEITINTFGVFPELGKLSSMVTELTGSRLVHRGRLGEISITTDTPASAEALKEAHAKAEAEIKRHLEAQFPGSEPELGQFQLTIDHETYTPPAQ